METETITINMEKKVIDKLRSMAKKEKQKKGFLGRTITEATKKYISEKEQEEIAKKQLRKMERGYNMGKILIKHRSELYER